MLKQILAIAAAGGAGCVLRYLISLAAYRALGAWRWLPLGTLLVNVLGCAAMGALLAWSGRASRESEALRVALAVGLLGGLTTFSSFSAETLSLARDGRDVTAILYVLITNTLCLFAAYGGYKMAGGCG